MNVNQKCEASLPEDDDNHGSPVAKRWRLESDKLENEDSKHSGTNEMEEEEAICATSPEEFTEKDSIKNKQEDEDSKHSGTNEMEEEEAICATSPEEFIEKDSIKNKLENEDSKHSGTNEMEEEKAICATSPEEFIEKDSIKNKLENEDSKHSGTNEMEEEEAICATSPEEFIEKDSIKNKSENVGCNHSETTGKEKEETVCSLPEEFIGKENKKDDCEEIDQQSNESCQYEFGEATCKCVEEFKRKECEKNMDTILLPSSVNDKEEIFFPDSISNEDPSIYGKWLIFTNGNLILQNHLWIQLQNLVQDKHLILIGSSTAKMCENRDSFQGVIKCYTSKDINVIRRAGLLIQNVLKDDCILDYKTNEASQKNFFRATGKRFIAKFMLTVNGKLYKRDKLCRWIQITNAEYENFKFEENFSENVTPFANRQQSESNLLPSKETRKKKKRYVYPERASMNNSSLLLCLFCNVDDTDANGLTELDRVWNEAKALRDEKIFKSIFCETYASHNPSKETNPRRTIMCEMYDYPGVVDLVIKCADKLREKVPYNSPVYYKHFFAGYKPDFKLKYLYTEDRELYEYTEAKWKLLKRV